MPAGTGPGAPVPRAEDLEALPADDWALLLTHARAALNALDDALLDLRVRQLRALPAGRLAGGRARRDLCAAVARGGPLWREVSRRLADDEVAAERLAWLLAGERAPGRPAPAPAPEPARRPTGPSREDRLADRVRQLVAERDDATRRATGLEARLRTEQARADDVEAALAETRRELEALRAQLEAAAAERESALDRQRRQHEAQIAQAREELREYRREEHAREERRRREEAAREAARREAEERARQEVEADRERLRRSRRARPGRPSRLPAGVTPGTVEAVETLLTRGRRVHVDGYNVTKQHRGHLPLEQQRNWLVSTLEGLVARTRVEVTVVFDGDPLEAGVPGPPTRGPVRVTFTAGQSADDLLVELAAGLPPDEPLIVVTDDRELTERLQRLRVDVVRTGSFLAAAT